MQCSRLGRVGRAGCWKHQLAQAQLCQEMLCSSSRPEVIGGGKSWSPPAVRRGRAGPSRRSINQFCFFTALSKGFTILPSMGGRPCCFPGLATFTVPGPSSGEIRLGRKEFLSPVRSSPCERPPPPKISHSAPNLPPQALQPLLSPGAAAPHEVGSSGALSEMKTFLQVLG